MSDAFRLTSRMIALACDLVMAAAVVANTSAASARSRRTTFIALMLSAFDALFALIRCKRQGSRLQRPRLDLSRVAMRMVALLQVVQVDEHLVEAPVEHHRRRVGLAEELRNDLERRLGHAVQAGAHALDPFQHRAARGSDLLRDLAERPCV